MSKDNHNYKEIIDKYNLSYKTNRKQIPVNFAY